MIKQVIFFRDKDSDTREAKRIAFEQFRHWRYINTFWIGKWNVLLFRYTEEETRHATSTTQ